MSPIAASHPSLWWLWGCLVLLAIWTWLIDRRSWRVQDAAKAAEKSASEANAVVVKTNLAGQQADRAVKKFGNALFHVEMAGEIVRSLPALEQRLEFLEEQVAALGRGGAGATGVEGMVRL